MARATRWIGRRSCTSTAALSTPGTAITGVSLPRSMSPGTSKRSSGKSRSWCCGAKRSWPVRCPTLRSASSAAIRSRARSSRTATATRGSFRWRSAGRNLLLGLSVATLAMPQALAQESATTLRAVPNALVTIDQHRATVVERIVGEWGDRLASSNAGISAPHLRQILSSLRSDHLLAASLAGSIEGLRDVVSAALVHTDAKISPTLMRTKSLGDTTDDLVYTPVVPCRIVDTRSGGGGVFLPGNQRNWLAYSLGGFASQGGSATNCRIFVRPVAIMANTTLANTVGGPEFFVLWPFNQTRPLAATVNWWASAQQPANAEIVPLCSGSCTADFSAYASGQTHAIIDVLGYFNRPTNYGGTHTITGSSATDSGGDGNTASGVAST